ncbi:MAG TPA: hypothetical protein VMS11_02205 [Solirubrobacterales bacterium]|nr:hypothetical protein [Solirubrobacterales bacterium]
MTAPKTLAVLGLLCALIVSAFAAQAASAASQTAVECTSTGTPLNTDRFADKHCKTLEAGGSIFHAATPEKTKIASEGTNITTEPNWEPAILKTTIAGVEVRIEAKFVTLLGNTGTIENNTSGEEMYAEGLASEVHIAEVSVTNPPNCEFIGITPGGTRTPETLIAQPMRATTKGQEKGIVKLEPQSGNLIAEFEIAGAGCPAGVRGTWPVYGTIASNKAEGATVPFKHKTVTEAKTLRLKNAISGPVAGFEARITVRKTSGPVPIALT